MRLRVRSVVSGVRRRWLGTVAVASLLGLVGSAAASAAQSAPGVGAPGIGDPYYPDYGNGGYDVSHYSIDVGYTPGTGRLTGQTTLRATATQALRRFNLDLLLPVTGVSVNGRAASFDQSGNRHELKVTPAVPLRAGDSMVVEVAYAGRPADISDGAISPWITTADGAIALGEPEIAAWWFPSNDHPRDKATFDISIRVPRGVEAISNGRLVSKTQTGAVDRWQWTVTSPMATYLAFMAIGQYDVTSGTTPSGLPWLNAIQPTGSAEMQGAARDLARTPEIVEWLERQWGPYPFEAIGGVAVDQSLPWRQGLGAQTRPVYGKWNWPGGVPGIAEVVRMLAHQWYGSSVSVENWRDIALTVGFSEYSAWRWNETHGGGTGNFFLKEFFFEVWTDDEYWEVPPGDPGAGNEIAWQVYARSPMALQALRNRVGSPAFFQIMRTWATQHRHGNASVEQFIALAERQSGQQLDGFFDAWFFARSAPALTRANGLDPHWYDDFRAARTPRPAEVEASIRSLLRPADAYR